MDIVKEFRIQIRKRNELIDWDIINKCIDKEKNILNSLGNIVMILNSFTDINIDDIDVIDNNNVKFQILNAIFEIIIKKPDYNPLIPYINNLIYRDFDIFKLWINHHITSKRNNKINAYIFFINFSNISNNEKINYILSLIKIKYIIFEDLGDMLFFLQDNEDVLEQILDNFPDIDNLKFRRYNENPRFIGFFHYLNAKFKVNLPKEVKNMINK